MAATLPSQKVVAVQAGTTTSNGTGGIPNTGYKIHTTPLPVAQRNKPWLPRWHQAHPANVAASQ